MPRMTCSALAATLLASLIVTGCAEKPAPAMKSPAAGGAQAGSTMGGGAEVPEPAMTPATPETPAAPAEATPAEKPAEATPTPAPEKPAEPAAETPAPAKPE